MHYSDNLDRLNLSSDELGDDKVDRQTRQAISNANSACQRGLLAKVIYWPGVSGVEGLKSTTPGPRRTCCDQLQLIVCTRSLCIFSPSTHPLYSSVTGPIALKICEKTSP